MNLNTLKITECPRDAMQGWIHFIPTDQKIAYLNQLLKVGFDVLDFGSFVSRKAIPQLADTKEVLKGLDLSGTRTQLLAIVANIRGALEAIQYETISFLGFPFSISQTFQLRNTNKTIEQSLIEVEEIQKLCTEHHKKLVVYISMGFGNPYGDEYNPEVVIYWFQKLADMGIGTIALADTVGIAQPETISWLFDQLIPEFPQIETGAHFHSTPDTFEEKIQAAYNSGCMRFDSSIKGIGGCPMANDDLVGNIATEKLLSWAAQRNIETHIHKEELNAAIHLANQVFI